MMKTMKEEVRIRLGEDDEAGDEDPRGAIPVKKQNYHVNNKPIPHTQQNKNTPYPPDCMVKMKKEAGGGGIDVASHNP